MNLLTPYPSIRALGHRSIAQLFNGHVLIEEKVDGSQFSFGLIGGRLQCRSKGQEICIDQPEKMFGKAIEYLKTVQHLMSPGWTYRGEYLQKPKHNCLAYSRVPRNHIIIFDVMMQDGHYLSPTVKREEAQALGLECVTPFYTGPGAEIGLDTLQNYFEYDSVLGGCKVEGVVVKNYLQTDEYGHPQIGKFVCPAFKEKHAHQWKTPSVQREEFVASLAQSLCTEARWHKAIQHLRDAGKLQEGPEDIGPLLKEINADVLREESDDIKEALFKHFWPQIARGITKGFPDWYKNELTARAALDMVEA